MGWASAGPIFDCVANALLRENVEDAKTTAILADLIKELCDGDWDTLNESIDEFLDKPAVIAAFQIAAPSWLDEFRDEDDDDDDENDGNEETESPPERAYEHSGGHDH
jgi:hypothetical protein